MHDIKSIRDNPQAFDAAFTRRGLEPIAESLIGLDEARRMAIIASEQAQARRNAASKEIGEAKKAKDNARAEALMAEVTELKTTMPALDEAVKAADAALKKALSEIPNLPLAEVPEGADEHGNVVRSHFGQARDYAFTPKPHYELGEALGQMDFEAAAKLSGARFVVLKSGLARLERAIGQFFLDVHTGEHGYTEVNPPLLVQDDAMFGTAQLPKFEEDQFGIDEVPNDSSSEQARRDASSLSEAGLEKCSERLEDRKQIAKYSTTFNDCGRRSISSRSDLNDRLAHPHRRSLAHQPRPRIHPRRKRTADAADRADAVFPRRGRGGRARYARHDPAASVHQGGTGVDHHAGAIQGRARADAVLRRGSAAPARAALSRHDAVHRRHGLCLAENLRHRSLDAGAGRGRRVPGNLVVLGVRRFPGAADGCALRAGRTASRASSTR